MSDKRMKKNTGNLGLFGQVVPGEWDENDELMQVLLLTDDNDEYVVELSGAGAKLAQHLEEWVEVVGSVRKKNGAKVLAVRSFELADESRELDFEEDWLTGE